MVLGVFPDNDYEQAELRARGRRSARLLHRRHHRGAQPRRASEYGEDRLAAAASAARTEPVEAMKDALLADVNAFTGGQFEDDATLIVVGIP